MTYVAVFDLDGTLINTPRAIVETFTAAFTAMEVEIPDASTIRATIGLPLEQSFSKLLGVPLDDDRVYDGMRQYQALFKEIVLPRAEELIFPGVADGLTILRDQGLILALATSKFYASADALLKAAGLRDHFSVVVGADQVVQPKPNPEMGQVIMQRLGISAERTVMVGDTTQDLLMAHAAGMRSVAVTYGVHSVPELKSSDPTCIADTFADIVKHIQNLASTEPREGQRAMTDSELVDQLLNDRTYHIEFNGHLTNHVKHAVVALAGLGISPQRIKAYHDNYVKLTPYGFELEAPKASKHEISEINWDYFFGKRTGYSAYCEFFDRKEKELGGDELLRQYLPVLLPGWVGAFTHATIHLGWALDVNNRWMMIEGLAYMAFAYVSCHPERASSVSHDHSEGELAVDSLLRIAGVWEDDHDAFQQWVETLVADTAAGIAAGIHPELVRSGLQYRIARLLEEGHPLIYETPAWIDDQDVSISWEQLYYVVTLLYLSVPGDFVLLHLITSLHAMEHIADHLPADQRKDAVKCFWVGMLCIIFSRAGFPKRTKLAALHATYENAVDPGEHSAWSQDWEQIIARAVEEEEEHNPKLVYVLQRVWERTGYRSIYRAAAAQFTATPEIPKSFEELPIE